MFELLLFASDDGELRCLEIVHYAEGTLAEFPSVDEFEASLAVQLAGDLDVLVEQDRVAVGVGDHEAGRA